MTFVINACNEATGSLIFLHGTGDSGRGIAESMRIFSSNKMQFPHIKMIFPTAPLLPFTAFGGSVVNTWYDISDFSEDACENSEHIEKSAKQIVKIINDEVSSGIPLDRIAVAGFSRGGAMSLHIGYSYLTNIAGVGVFSSFLPRTSPLYRNIKNTNDGYKLPPLFQAHGTSDGVIKSALGQETNEIFRTAGVLTEWKLYPMLGHELRNDALTDFHRFILSVIPEKI